MLDRSFDEVTSMLRAMAQFFRPPVAARAYQYDDGTVFDFGHRWGRSSSPEKSHSVTSNLDRYEPSRVVARARGLWLGEIARSADEREVEANSLTITPNDVARIVELVATGDLTDKLARQVIEGVISSEGGPDAVVAARGIKVVSDDSELMAAIERAIAAEPAAAERVRMASSLPRGAY